LCWEALAWPRRFGRGGWGRCRVPMPPRRGVALCPWAARCFGAGKREVWRGAPAASRRSTGHWCSRYLVSSVAGPDAILQDAVWTEHRACVRRRWGAGGGQSASRQWGDTGQCQSGRSYLRCVVLVEKRRDFENKICLRGALPMYVKKHNWKCRLLGKFSKWTMEKLSEGKVVK